VLRYLKILYLYLYYFISFMVVILLSSKEDDYFAVPVFGHPRATVNQMLSKIPHEMLLSRSSARRYKITPKSRR